MFKLSKLGQYCLQQHWQMQTMWMQCYEAVYTKCKMSRQSTKMGTYHSFFLALHGMHMPDSCIHSLQN